MAELILKAIMCISCMAFVLSMCKYIWDYKIIQLIFIRLRGKMDEYDRIRREQMRLDVERDAESFLKKNRIPLISEIYNTIDKTGLPDTIPGFSELGLILILIALCLTAGGVGTYLWNPVVGVIIAVASLIIAWYSLSLMTYNRRIKVEDQLLALANACSSASLQYSSIIDIFGATYEQFDNPLRNAMEECYIEAKKTQNEELALYHMKEKFDSHQLAFVIDNFRLCSESTGNYHKAAKEIASAIMIYSRSHERKVAILRNAKVLISIMFGLSLAILFFLGKFLGDPKELYLGSAMGVIILILMLVVYFYGMNARAE